MITVYADAHSLHQPDYEVYNGNKTPYPETEARTESIINELQRRGKLTIQNPRSFPRRHIEEVHQLVYIEFLRLASKSIQTGITLQPSYFLSDTYAPLTNGTYSASLSAVNQALTGAQLILSGEKYVYSLCRPPGHHASLHAMGGYCYFNNASIAANYLSKHGRVAILDIDYHHGNGTQDIFYKRSDVLYVSLHANPRDAYPYSSGFASEKGEHEGLGYNINFPLAINTTDQSYLRTLKNAVSKIQSFNPDYLIVSAGFDTYNMDPIGGLRLTRHVYRECGRLIGSVRANTLIVQEGGYNIEDLGYLAAEFLEGIESQS